MPDVNELISNMSIVMIVIFGAGILLTLVITLVVLRFVRQKIGGALGGIGPNRTVLEQGIPARARILSVQQTGLRVNDQPQIAFQLEVHPTGSASYQAVSKAVIPIVHIPQFQPGAEVPVKIHPTDPSQVVLDVYG